MLDLCNIVNTRPIYARKLSNFAVVPHKRDVGLNVIENEIIPSDLESFRTRGTWV